MKPNILVRRHSHLYFNKGKPCWRNADNLQYAMQKENVLPLMEQSNMDGTSSLTTMLSQHSLRVNYPVANWKRANIPQPDVTLHFLMLSGFIIKSANLFWISITCMR